MVATVAINNIWTTISSEDEELLELAKKIAGFRQVGWERARQQWMKRLAKERRANLDDWEYKRALNWDGWRFIGEECGTDCVKIPTGCTIMFVTAASALEKELKIFNNRVPPLSLEEDLAIYWGLKDDKEPRPYQKEAVETLINSGGRGIIQSPTASGKTYMMAMLISHYKTTTLIKVPRLVIQDQILEEIKQSLHINKNDIGFIGRGKYEPSLITVTTTQSLASIKKDRKQWNDFLNLHRTHGWGLLIEDECFPEGTLISTPKGVIPIEDIVVGNIVFSFNEATKKIEENRVIKKHVRNSFIKRVTTYSGFIDCTTEHPFYTYNSNSVCNIETIDSAMKKRSRPSRLIVPSIPMTDVKTIDRWYLWGLVAGDFTINYGKKKSNVIRTSVRKKDKIELFRSLKSKFGLKESINSRGDHSFWFIDKNGKLRKWFNEHGILSGKKSTTIKYIPENNDFQEWVSLLRGLFDADGCATIDRVLLELTSEQMIKQVRRMLRILGIRSSITIIRRSLKNEKHNDMFRVQIAGRENLLRFESIIGFRRVKPLNKLREIISSLKKDRTFDDTGFRERIIDNSNELRFTKVYNLEVEKNHNFIAEGYLVHNCHHSSSATSWDTSMAIDAYYRVGFSATPLEREDNENIKIIGAYGEIVYRVPSEPLVEDGFLIRPTIKFLPMKPVPIERNAMWPAVYNTSIVYNQNRNRDIIRIANEMREEGRSTLVFVDRIDHGIELEHMASIIPELKEKVKFIHGNHPDRETLLTDFKSRRLPVLIATEGIIGEGFDFRGLDAIIVADGGKSYIQTIQKVGRGMRIEEGKKDVKIFDFGDRGKYIGEHAMRRKTSWKKHGFEVDTSDTPYMI